MRPFSLPIAPRATECVSERLTVTLSFPQWLVDAKGAISFNVSPILFSQSYKSGTVGGLLLIFGLHPKKGGKL